MFLRYLDKHYIVANRLRFIGVEVSITADIILKSSAPFSSFGKDTRMRFVSNFTWCGYCRIASTRSGRIDENISGGHAIESHPIRHVPSCVCSNLGFILVSFMICINISRIGLRSGVSPVIISTFSSIFFESISGVSRSRILLR